MSLFARTDRISTVRLFPQENSPLERSAMRRVLAFGLVLLFPLLSAAQDGKKSPVPSKEDQAGIQKLLDEIYGAQYAKAQKDPVERAELARNLLNEGRLTKNNVPGRYVQFSQAHALAAQAGDVATALAAADELANEFLIPPSTIFQMKIKMLQQASAVVGAPPDAYQSVIDRALVILDDTLDADDYPSSLDLITAAEQAARKLRRVALVVSMRKRQEEIGKAQKEFARWQPFAEMLIKTPDDPKANLEMGKYHALIKGNWDRGLPLLARGGKGNLQGLAQIELSDKMQPLFQAKGWHIHGATLSDPTMKTNALLRAYYWFQESLSNADDKTRAAIDLDLLDIAKQLPAEYRIGEITSELKKVDVPSGPVYGCAFSPDAKRFLITGYDGALRVFNAKTFKEIRQLEGHAGKVFCVALGTDNRAVSGGFDGTVRLWDLSAGRMLKSFDGHKDYVRSVAISSDGKWLLSGGDDRTVRLWNVAAGKEERTLTGHDHTVWCVAFSRDGKRALSASLDKTARLWDVEKGATIQKLNGHRDTVLCVAFSPDGRHAVTGSTDKTLRLWDLETGTTLQTFEGSNGYIQSVAVSPDGRRVISAGSDNVVRLWDAQTGKEIRKLEGHRDQVWHVAFSRDGRFAISSGQDNSVRLWK